MMAMASEEVVISAPNEDEEIDLVCEGYLVKLRGFARNRKRWFRLFPNSMAFYEFEGGPRIAITPRSNIANVVDGGFSSRNITITTTRPFGKSGQSTMTLQAPSMGVKEKWLTALRLQPGMTLPRGPVVCEGNLNKLQTMGSGMNRLRWFELTHSSFNYYDAEGGNLMAHCDVATIQLVTPKGEDAFSVHANVAFTKTGQSAVVVQCERPEVARKWLIGFRSVVGSKAQMSTYKPLPATRKYTGGTIAYDPNVKTTEVASEGNRFIVDQNL